MLFIPIETNAHKPQTMMYQGFGSIFSLIVLIRSILLLQIIAINNQLFVLPIQKLKFWLYATFPNLRKMHG